MNEQIDLIVFDWDGTLVDSVGKILQCVELTFELKGFKPPSRASAKALIGKSLPIFMQTLLPHEDESTIQDLCQQYRWNWNHGDLPVIKTFPGVLQMLTSLNEQGFLQAIATGKSRGGLMIDMERLNLSDYFRVTRCADESGSKPDPAMLNWICTQLDISPERTLVVGDTTHDLEMAKRAGAKSAGVLSGCHTVQQLSEFDPLVVFEKTTDILGWLKNESNP